MKSYLMGHMGYMLDSDDFDEWKLYDALYFFGILVSYRYEMSVMTSRL